MDRQLRAYLDQFSDEDLVRHSESWENGAKIGIGMERFSKSCRRHGIPCPPCEQNQDPNVFAGRRLKEIKEAADQILMERSGLHKKRKNSSRKKQFKTYKDLLK